MKEDRRKDSRRKRDKAMHSRILGSNVSLKNTLYISGIIIALGVIAFFATVIIYKNNLEKIYSDLEITEVAETSEDDTEEASLDVGRSVEELEEEIQASTENEEAIEVGLDEDEITVEDESNTSNSVAEKETISNESEQNTEEDVTPSFIAPVEGEIIKKYAKDSLVYSDTLKEWITHSGIDIKAEKATIVKAAARAELLQLSKMILDMV